MRLKTWTSYMETALTLNHYARAVAVMARRPSPPPRCKQLIRIKRVLCRGRLWFSMIVVPDDMGLLGG